MGKSRKGYIMGSKLHKMALCKSPLKQTLPKTIEDINSKKERVKDLKNLVVKEGSRRIKKGLVRAAIPAALGETAVVAGGIVPAMATYGTAKTIGGIKNYLDEHGTEVKAFKDQPSWQDLSKKAGGPEIKSSLPDSLKSKKQLRQEGKL